MSNTAIIIGSGFSGLSAASFMAQKGWKVTVLEKHDRPGGRARQLCEQGFTFDMGPSWYWMPDVFDRYFSCFGKKTSDYYTLRRLDPSYKIFWPDIAVNIPADIHALKNLFESWETGAGKKLEQFLSEAAFKYKIGMQKLVYKPGLSVREFADWEMLKGIVKMDVFTSIRHHVKKYFTHPRIREIMEFPVLFLGALPEHTPALYSLMNYADIEGGTWYPDGGMFSVVNAMHQLAIELGVTFEFDQNVTRLNIEEDRISAVQTAHKNYQADVVIASADYHFVEQELLPEEKRTYNKNYWNNRSMAPSCLIYYVGVNKKIDNIQHHNLFFDTDFSRHAEEIYYTKSWPTSPLFYVCASSVTDENAAPPGHENLFFLVPVAAGLSDDDEATRERYFNIIIERFQQQTGENILNHIIYKKTFSYTDFVNDYNAFKGNAYGLANTLKQTAVFKPRCKSGKLTNLYYTGQLTVPGPGVPPALISGEVVAGVIHKSKKW